MIGSKVSFWEYDQAGDMTKYVGVVLDRFVDPDERHHRPSLAVQMDDGSVQTPYEDECSETDETETYEEKADRFEYEGSFA